MSIVCHFILNNDIYFFQQYSFNGLIMQEVMRFGFWFFFVFWLSNLNLI